MCCDFSKFRFVRNSEKIFFFGVDRAHTVFYGNGRCLHNYVYLLNFFSYIYKYLEPDKSSLLSFIQFPQD